MTTSSRRPGRIGLIALMAWSLTGGREALATDACPAMTRDQIIDIAKTGVGCPYVWGGTCWNPADTSWKGADCSGYVTKCWQVPAASVAIDCTPHYYTTDSFYSDTTHWFPINMSELEAGDALVYRSGTDGHIVLFAAFTSTTGCYDEYEARGTAYGIVHRVKCPDSTYQARRRHNLTTTTPPPPPQNQIPTGLLEAADCDSIRGWAYDPDAGAEPIFVHVFFDAPPGQAGATGYAVLADKNRPELMTSLGSASHGFSFAPPAKFKDGQNHLILAYAIDSAGGQDPELAGSPMSIACSRPLGDAGPDPLPLDAAGPLPDNALSLPPPAYENPDDDRPEHDVEMVGSCGCQGAGARGGGPVGLATVAALLLLLAWRGRRRG